MSNRLFQSVIHQMKGVVDRHIGVIDPNGIITACSELSHIGEIRADVREELSFAQQRLLEEGALDVFTLPMGMTPMGLTVVSPGTVKSIKEALSILI